MREQIETADQMSTNVRNTNVSFGSVSKTLHWLTALLILTMIPLGVVAQYWPYDNSQALATKASLFSLHKTLGLLTFFVGLIRITWSVTQIRPAPLSDVSWLQGLAAHTAHFTLYGSLVLVPLSGWIHHAASTGFAPIWWPFGQTLPFVPQSVPVADAFASLHFVFIIVLVLSLAAHIGGALKHHFIDRDATLLRMLPGRYPVPADLPGAHTQFIPAILASFVWVVAMAIGLTLGVSQERSTASQLALKAVPSQWAVQQGTLAITVQQLNQPVEGQFSEWTAAIAFEEEAVDGVHGSVDVTIATLSLDLGGVTSQAIAPEFLNVEAFPTATFSGVIRSADEGYVVDGDLSLVGKSVPLQLPFDLVLDGDIAIASGTVMLDRRDFGLGSNYGDEATVGFSVQIDVTLTAKQSPD